MTNPRFTCEQPVRELTLEEKITLVQMTNECVHLNKRLATATRAGDEDRQAELIEEMSDHAADGALYVSGLIHEGVRQADIDACTCFTAHYKLSDESVICSRCWQDEMDVAALQADVVRIGRTSKDCDRCGHDNQQIRHVEEPQLQRSTCPFCNEDYRAHITRFNGDKNKVDVYIHCGCSRNEYVATTMQSLDCEQQRYPGACGCRSCRQAGYFNEDSIKEESF